MTEGLLFVLRRSQPARSALLRLLNSTGASLPIDLRFTTQVAGDDQAIPDLVGEDDNGHGVLIVEAKFWAGLTEAQPVAYIRRLEAIGGGVLAMIAPEPRIALLRHELMERCARANIGCANFSSGPGINSIDIAPGGKLVLLDWRTLLTTIRGAVEATGDAGLIADVLQLRGLCERMDAEAFRPLTSEELTGSIGRRIVQLNQLVDETFSRLAKEGPAAGGGLRSSAGAGWYGRYCRLNGVPALIMMTMMLWGTAANTPLWVRITWPEWKRSPEIGKRLAPLVHAGMQVFDWPDGHAIPIAMPIATDRETVLREILRQIRIIAEHVRPLGSSQSVEIDGPPLEPGLTV